MIVGSLCFHVSPSSFMNKDRNLSQHYCGRLSWSCFSNGFPRSCVLFSLVSIDSVTNLSTPFTILTQDAVWSSNKDGTRTSILYRSSRLQTFMLKTAQISCSCKSILSYVSLFRPDPLCILSAQMLHLFSFFWVKSFGVLSFFDQPQTRFRT